MFKCLRMFRNCSTQPELVRAGLRWPYNVGVVVWCVVGVVTFSELSTVSLWFYLTYFLIKLINSTFKCSGKTRSTLGHKRR